MIKVCYFHYLVCGFGTFGNGCAYVCHCKDGGPCNDVDGNCNGKCQPGWHYWTLFNKRKVDAASITFLTIRTG